MLVFVHDRIKEIEWISLWNIEHLVKSERMVRLENNFEENSITSNQEVVHALPSNHDNWTLSYGLLWSKNYFISINASKRNVMSCLIKSGWKLIRELREVYFIIQSDMRIETCTHMISNVWLWKYMCFYEMIFCIRIVWKFSTMITGQ